MLPQLPLESSEVAWHLLWQASLLTPPKNCLPTSALQNVSPLDGAFAVAQDIHGVLLVLSRQNTVEPHDACIENGQRIH